MRMSGIPSIAQLEERKTVMDTEHLDVAGSIPARRIDHVQIMFAFVRGETEVS